MRVKSMTFGEALQMANLINDADRHEPALKGSNNLKTKKER